MKGFLQDIVIAVLVFVICLIIAIVTGANFLWLLLPVAVIILLAILGNLLRQRYGSTYGVTAYLFLFFAVPLLWYLFCSQMPITALTLKTQQKAEDFSSFSNYEESIDAKQQFVDYQLKQDSILKQVVSKLLSENKVDSALALIKQSKSNSDKIKKELLTKPNVKNEQKKEDNEENTITIVGTCKGKSTVYFYAERPFSLRLSLDKGANGFFNESMPAGNSSRHFDNPGSIVVNEPNRTDIKIIKVKFDR